MHVVVIVIMSSPSAWPKTDTMILLSILCAAKEMSHSLGSCPRRPHTSAQAKMIQIIHSDQSINASPTTSTGNFSSSTENLIPCVSSLSLGYFNSVPPQTYFAAVLAYVFFTSQVYGKNRSLLSSSHFTLI